jgi:hypothetical protein
MCNRAELNEQLENQDFMANRGKLVTLREYLDNLNGKLKRESTSLAGVMNSLATISHEKNRRPHTMPDINTKELQNRVRELCGVYEEAREIFDAILAVEAKMGPMR